MDVIIYNNVRLYKNREYRRISILIAATKADARRSRFSGRFRNYEVHALPSMQQCSWPAPIYTYLRRITRDDDVSAAAMQTEYNYYRIFFSQTTASAHDYNNNNYCSMSTAEVQSAIIGRRMAACAAFMYYYDVICNNNGVGRVQQVNNNKKNMKNIMCILGDLSRKN